MKHGIRICVVLMLVCTLMTAALAAINAVTAPLIEKGEQQKRNDILSDFFPIMVSSQANESDIASVSAVYTVFGAESDIIGYCVDVTETGYAGDVSMMVAVSEEGAILGVSLVSHSETKGLSEKKEASALCDRFEGKTGQQKFTENGGSIDKIAGATYSSRAVLNGVNHALAAVSALMEGGASS